MNGSVAYDKQRWMRVWGESRACPDERDDSFRILWFSDADAVDDI